MWSLEDLCERNTKAARDARRKKRQPYHLTDPAEVKEPFPFPYLGDACDDFDSTRRRLEPDLFVDSSGFGRDGEAALSADGFKRELVRLLQEHGELHVAVSVAGEFQVFVAVWVPR